MLSHIRLFATPWTVACQAPLSIGFSRQEYWSGLPFPSPGESSQPRDRTEVSRIASGFFTNWATRPTQSHIKFFSHHYYAHQTVLNVYWCVYCFLNKVTWTHNQDFFAFLKGWNDHIKNSILFQFFENLNIFIFHKIIFISG